MMTEADVKRIAAEINRKGYKQKDVVGAMWATLWVVLSMAILLAGLLGILIGRLS